MNDTFKTHSVCCFCLRLGGEVGFARIIMQKTIFASQIGYDFINQCNIYNKNAGCNDQFTSYSMCADCGNIKRANWFGSDSDGDDSWTASASLQLVTFQKSDSASVLWHNTCTKLEYVIAVVKSIKIFDGSTWIPDSRLLDRQAISMGIVWKRFLYYFHYVHRFLSENKVEKDGE